MTTARQPHLDWVRGLAVLVMVEAHVFDSWVAAGERAQPVFGRAMVLGGFGAPLFLFLAGVALVLSAESRFRKSGDFDRSWAAARNRGLQILGLAFLFRLQSYVLGGGVNPGGLLKVDILNVMGPAVALAAMAGAQAGSRRGRIALFAAITAAIAMATPLVRQTAILGVLPDPLEWYFRPTPGRTNFTLFPWAGFVFAGAAQGAALAAGATGGPFQLGFGVAGVATAVLAYWASFQPSWYARSDFWTSSPSFFFLRTGLLVAVLSASYAWVHRPDWAKFSRWSPLQVLGRASLFVYWVHVEMVYGVFSRPLRRSLTFPQALGAYTLFVLFLLALVVLKSRLTEEGRMPAAPRPDASPASI